MEKATTQAEAARERRPVMEAAVVLGLARAGPQGLALAVRAVQLAQAVQPAQAGQAVQLAQAEQPAAAALAVQPAQAEQPAAAGQAEQAARADRLPPTRR